MSTYSAARRAALLSAVFAVPHAAYANDAAEREYLPSDIIVSAKVEGYVIDDGSTATKTPTPLIDVPQSVSVITADQAGAEQFLTEVDSAIVLHNASTQYADGGEFGFGGEIGISTDRLHARGPVGAEQLTTFKYVVRGKGQTRP